MAGVLAILLGLSITQISNLQLRLSAASLVPQGSQSVAADDQAVIIGAVAREGDIFAPSALSAVRSLSDRLQQVPGGASVLSIANLPYVDTTGGALSTTPILRVGMPPTEQAQRLRSEVADNPILIAADGQATAIYLGLKRGVDEALAEIRAIIADPPDNLTLLLGGGLVAQQELGGALLKDILLFMPALVIALSMVVWLTYRDPALVILIVAKLAIVLVLTSGAMGLFGLDVYVPTLILPVVLLVTAVSADIFAIDRCLNALLTPGNIGRWGEVAQSAVWDGFGALAFSAASTMAGMASLIATGLPPYRDFGIAGAIGIGISFVLTMTLIPVMVAHVPVAAMERIACRRQTAFAGASRAGGRPTPLGFIVPAMVIACGLVLAPRVAINDSWVANMAHHSRVVADDTMLNQLFAGTTTLSLRFSDAGSTVLEPDLAERIMKAEQALRQTDGVKAVQPAYGEILGVVAAISGQTEWDYRHLPTRDELAQGDMMLRTLRQYPVPITISADATTATTAVFLNASDYLAVKHIAENVLPALRREYGLSIEPFGDGWDGYRAVSLVARGHLVSILIALAANFILAAFLFRSALSALLVMLPSCCTILAIHSGLSLLNVSMGIATAMYAAVAIGSGVDYSIHLLAAYRKARARGQTLDGALDIALRQAGAATATAAITVIAAVSVLLLSQVPPNRDLGLLISLALLMSASFSLLIVPQLLRVVGERI